MGSQEGVPLKRNSKGSRRSMGVRRNEHDSTLDRHIKGYDISENSNTRLKFRKIPYPFWIIGGLFWLGAFFCLYLIYMYGEENGHGLFVINEWK
jgi:hypothetical protein